MNEQPIDPRYDPAFQRGFTGSVQTGAHPHGVVRSSRPATRPPEQREAPAPVAPASARPPSGSPPSAASASAAPGIDEVVPAEFEADDADEVVAEQAAAPVRRLTRNPFLIVLALLGAALAVAGASWAIAGRATMTSSGSLASERDYWFVQSALLGAPILIAVGVAILAGVLFVFANAWNRAN